MPPKSRSRRSFLEAAAAASALALAKPSLAQPPVVSTPVSSFDPWVELHPRHLQHNIAEIRRRARGRPVLVVAKNNGYGLGVANVGRMLEADTAVHGFAVVKLHEACVLREAGIRKPLLLMGPFDERNLDEMVARDIMPMLYTPIGPALDRAAARAGKHVPVHICVDTGIGRVGVPYRQAPSLIRDLAARASIRIDGIMMTFSEDPSFDPEQLRRFTALCDELEGSGVKLGRRHTASSFGLFQHPGAFLDMVRPGMAVYGVYSEPDFRKSGALDLRPAVSLKAKVAYVKQLETGESAGYNRAYVAKQPVWLATLPVGHSDGLPRVAAKGGKVRINDALYPIIASVSASHTIVEIGPEPRVRAGDVATIFDWQEGSRPEDLGASCGASVYDLTMHLNPLMPRVIV
jgi:alanine racemase